MKSRYIVFPILRFLLLTVAVVWSIGGGSVRAHPDSTAIQDPIELETVEVQAFFRKQPLLRTTAAAAVVGRQTLQQAAGTSLLAAINTVAGVQMEERSPGSYRLSIRGSLLRSPFGVRNVKMYLGDIPLTDAGGNTYLNLLDPGAVSGMEVLKGPDGSLFGANSGGVVILRPADPDPTEIRIQGGSYGLLHQQAGVGVRVSDQYRFNLHQSFQHSDGYRDHAALRRHYIQTIHHWHYRRNRPNQLRALVLYGDLDYQTPGGLTKEQYDNRPKGARPATASMPGAKEQQAGIRNRTGVAGLTHEWFPGAELKHVASIFGSYVDFRNPFITNFEKRVERNLGLRAYLSYQLPFSNEHWSMRAQMGTEWQKGNYTIRNFDNAGGQPGRIQVADRIHVLGGTTFLRVEADFRQRWLLEAALSHNAYHNRFEAIDTDSGPGDLTAENSGEHPNPTSYRLPSTWMPRVAVSYHPAPSMTWRSVVSKGFSPPTTAEIRPSDNTVNTSLQAESGWNFETGFRLATRGQWLFGDLSIFRYELRNALVRGSRESGAEFFRNAGGIGQSGIELAFNVRLTGGEASATGMRAYPQIHWSGSWTWSDFRFVDYRINGTDYTGNALTGVPKHTLMNAFYLESVGPWNAHLMHRFVSRTPLNDANTVFADAYHLVQARVSRIFPLGTKLSGSIFVWVDNLLDQRYSLGNDINAFGERYFNAAPGRNASAGISLQF